MQPNNAKYTYHIHNLTSKDSSLTYYHIYSIMNRAPHPCNYKDSDHHPMHPTIDNAHIYTVGDDDPHGKRPPSSTLTATSTIIVNCDHTPTMHTYHEQPPPFILTTNSAHYPNIVDNVHYPTMLTANLLTCYISLV
jgi:hypothetical protein